MAENKETTKAVVKFNDLNANQVVATNLAKNLSKELRLNSSQIAKANAAILKLAEANPNVSKASILNAVYSTAIYDYKNKDAIAYINYGGSLQVQFQYPAYIEDILATGHFTINDIIVTPLYANIKYETIIDKNGYKIIKIPTIKVDDPFAKIEIIGYYAYAKSNEGKEYSVLMSSAELEKHAQTFSKAHKYAVEQEKKGVKATDVWTMFKDKMCKKTVIKKLGKEISLDYPNDRLASSINNDQLVYDDNGNAEYKDNPKVIDLTEAPKTTNAQTRLTEVIEAKVDNNGEIVSNDKKVEENQQTSEEKALKFIKEADKKGK